MSKKIFILGGGYGGIQAALTLQKKKKKTDDIEIYLIDKNPYHTLLTELHEVAANRIEEDGVIVYLKDIFKYTDVHVIQDYIQQIDFEKQILKSPKNEYSYDYLIMAIGSEPNFYGIEGMKENSFTLWSYKDALTIKNHILEMFQKASLEKDPSKRRAYLTFAVGGGGFTGTEMIGELALWVNDLAKQYDVNRDEVRLILIETLPNILPILDNSLVEKSVKYLKNKLGVEVLTNSKITKVDKTSFVLNDNEIINSHTLIWTGGVQANRCLSKFDLETGKSQRVCVDEYTKTHYKNVFAIGDFSLFITEDNKPLPALVEAALETGKSAAINILNSIRGKELEKAKPKLHGVMVSVSKNYAVANIMGMKLSGLPALFMKHLVNIHYLFGIGGFEIIRKYLNHEFWGVKHKKRFFHDHLEKTTPTFLIVILRLYLGYMWLMSGIEKIDSGWFEYIMLGGSNVDGTSGASIMQLVSNHTPNWYAWIVDTFIIPNAMLFQKLVVLTELGLGLAFITGTFTFIAAIVSIGMNINFLLSTGLNDLWFLVTSIPMLFGAGRSFGVDYYLIPYLMRQWRYFVRNKKLKFNLWK
ncbi:FAD-dependent oxidoreductase [Defluviitalea phaphyphila]|uniref:FAD-dependent oxidoreductase n=1 Tax=Defluviitalea phaphyphila TaxID=1473580 RepID=UPI000730445C|nr:FAD-dependent oxidoreductase [Defluviitalea phaphyphila]